MATIENKSNKFIFKGVQLSLKNAENHLKAAETLAYNEQFGLATSHMVLAAEECAKSMLLFAKCNEENAYSLDFPLNNTQIKELYENYEFKKLFYKHAPKQDLAEFISMLGQIFAEFSPYPLPIIDKIIFSDVELNQSERKRIVETRNKQYKRIEDWKRYGKPTDLGLKKNREWWEHVNDNKNNGFYVGHQNGKWKSPGDVTKEEYQIAHQNVSGMVALLGRLLELYDPSEILD